MATSRYNSGELFFLIHLQNVQGNSFLEENTAKHYSTSDWSRFSWDIIRFKTKSFIRCKRHWDVRQLISGKKSDKNALKVKAWTPERVERLLEYPKGYKLTCDFNGKDFEQCLSAMNTEHTSLFGLAIDFFDEFGLKRLTEPEKPLN